MLNSELVRLDSEQVRKKWKQVRLDGGQVRPVSDKAKQRMLRIHFNLFP